MVGRRNIDRVMLVGIFGLAVWLVIVGRLFAVQVIFSREYKAKAREQHHKKESIRALRGVIYGRDGKQLAKNSIALDLWTTKGSIRNIDEVDSIFCEALGFERGYVENRIRNSSGDWLYLARRVELPGDTFLEKLEKDSVFSTIVYNRIYPYGRTASQLLGFVDVDGHGREGIELYYDDYLEGEDGERIVVSDAAGRPYRVYQLGGKPPVPGASIYLTIDPDLQQIVESELAAGVDSFGADNGMAVFLEPSTGEVLAMACYPDYDPNEPEKSDVDLRRIRQITDGYEPGSTFKIVAFSALLEKNAIALDETVDCEMGSWAFCNGVIHDAEKHGFLTAREVLVHSSNIGTIKLSLRLSPETLYSYARAFGFGSPTGIDLPGEVVGILHRPETWSGMTPAAFPMGHEVSVSAMQVVTAYDAIANRGLLVQPYLVKRIVDPSGRIIRERKPTKIRRVMDAKNAEVMCSLLKAVVDSGTGTKAAIRGLSVAGKTGTAAKPKKNGRGYSNDYISSFAGFAPVEAPQIVGVVVVDNPTRGPHWGGWTAAPIWKNIVTKAFATGVIAVADEKGSMSELAKTRYVTVPDVRRMTASQAISILKNRGLEPDISGSGHIVSQSPLPGQMVSPMSFVKLILKPTEERRGNKVEIPDVTGMSLRDAVVELAQANVKFRVVGAGVVEEQDPNAGNLINSNEICLLRCKIKKPL